MSRSTSQSNAGFGYAALVDSSQATPLQRDESFDAKVLYVVLGLLSVVIMGALVL